MDLGPSFPLWIGGRRWHCSGNTHQNNIWYSEGKLVWSKLDFFFFFSQVLILILSCNIHVINFEDFLSRNLVKIVPHSSYLGSLRLLQYLSLPETKDSPLELLGLAYDQFGSVLGGHFHPKGTMLVRRASLILIHPSLWSCHIVVWPHLCWRKSLWVVMAWEWKIFFIFLTINIQY